MVKLKTKVKTLANRLFVPGSIWKNQKKIEENVLPPQTEREKNKCDALILLGRAGALYLELFRGSAYLAGIGGLIYYSIK